MVETDVMETLAVPDLPEAAPQADIQELTEVPAAISENFLEKPFTDYTVTEGLLLVIVLLLILSQLGRIVKEGFHWL